jgi:hypothetical protein
MGTALAWWLVRSAGKAQALPDSKMLQAEASRIRSHRIMARLFREERPNRLRRQIMRQCLGELRHDFWRLWTLARLLAPYSRDPEFGVTLCAQLFVFHCLWGPLFVRTYVWGLDKGVAQFMSLVDGVEHMRKAAQSGVEGAEQLALDGLGA